MRSGLIELWDQIPAYLRPDAVEREAEQLGMVSFTEWIGLRNRSQIAAWAIGEHDASRLRIPRPTVNEYSSG